MTDQATPEDLQSIASIVSILKQDFDQILPHLANALKRDRAFDDLVHRLDVAERRLTSRADRPMVIALFQTLNRIRRLETPEDMKKVIEDDLLDLLKKFDYVETAIKLGDLFDPVLHEAVDGKVEGDVGIITKVYTKGLSFLDELLIPAKVQVGTQANEEEIF